MQQVNARTAHPIIPNLQFVKTLMSKFFPIRGYSSIPYNKKIHNSKAQTTQNSIIGKIRMQPQHKDNGDTFPMSIPHALPIVSGSIYSSLFCCLMEISIDNFRLTLFFFFEAGERMFMSAFADISFLKLVVFTTIFWIMFWHV